MNNNDQGSENTHTHIHAHPTYVLLHTTIEREGGGGRERGRGGGREDRKRERESDLERGSERNIARALVQTNKLTRVVSTRNLAIGATSKQVVFSTYLFLFLDYRSSSKRALCNTMSLYTY